MTLQDIMKELHESPKLKPDLLKDKAGNNFRAISESAILEVLNPLLDKAGIWYEVRVQKSNLDIREVWMNNVKALRFIATCEIALYFYLQKPEEVDPLDVVVRPLPFSGPSALAVTAGVGMGIDSGDKAMGKAMTYATKYALLKFFRLLYSDDPDATPSELLTTEVKPATEPKTAPKASSSKKKEPIMTEAMRDYILGLMAQKNIPEAEIIGKFHVEPSRDPASEISQRKAREIITFLQDHEDLTDHDLPF